ASTRRGVAAVSIRESYNDERHPVITEMLGKTTSLAPRPCQCTSKRATASLSSLDRGGPLLMMRVNYRWSAVVMDAQPLDQESRGPDRGTASGRSRNTSALMPRSGRGFIRVFSPAYHTMLLFCGSTEGRDAVPGPRIWCVSSLSILSAFAPFLPWTMPYRSWFRKILTEGYGHAAYDFPKAGRDISTVLLDGVLGACVQGCEGCVTLEEYSCNRGR
ncbi:hypothetical protein DFH07DRAFT_735844, partial [Mycena maculata]